MKTWDKGFLRVKDTLVKLYLYTRNLKRRRLSNNFIEDLSLSPLILSSLVLK